MKRQSVTAILGMVILLGTACQGTIRGSGNVVTESREVSDFDSVELLGSGRVLITQGEVESLTIDAEDNIMPLIEAKVSGRTLSLGFTDEANGKNVITTREIVFTLSLQGLSTLALTGSGDIEADEIDSEQLALDLTGSGNIVIEALRTPTLTVDVSGSGKVELGGEVAEQEVDISGSGQYRAGELSALDATVTVSGSGEATVWVVRDLEVDVEGSGSVSYYGEPAIREDVSGSGEVNRLTGR